MKTTKLLTTAVLTALCITLCARCGHDGGSDGVQIKRFEKVIFGSPADELPEILKKQHSEYAPLISGDLNDPMFVRNLTEFANDPQMKDVYNTVCRRYPDLGWLEQGLAQAMEKARKLFPDLRINDYYTLILGTFDYQSRIICMDSFLAIDISQYVIDELRVYNYYNMPMYMVEMLDSTHLLPDCMAAVGISLLPQNYAPQSMLDYMITNGKVLYFLDQVLPDLPQELKIRYTPQQWGWAMENESNIWGYLLQNQLLYDTDWNRIRGFVNEGPQTPQFSNSAPRLADFIGLQIITDYMENNKVSLPELFANTDSQKILTQSKYKPQRN
ncbi:MAG: hypothetical protein IK032_06840 [Bacteroidales bacterium]|nr:hypothetical protein [Bacteroidales bacterium]